MAIAITLLLLNSFALIGIVLGLRSRIKRQEEATQALIEDVIQLAVGQAVLESTKNWQNHGKESCEDNTDYQDN